MITLKINGRNYEFREGTTVAAAVLASGAAGFRRSVTGELRSAVCGMGICFECRARINGIPHQRTCMVEGEDGMEVETDAAD